MSETVESLDIKINATAKSAKDEITNLVGKIDLKLLHLIQLIN